MPSDISLHQIHEAIQAYNPFNLKPIVKHQDVWSTDFIDVEFLHSHASDAIFAKLDEISNAQELDRKIFSMVLAAEQGIGKTHLVRRLHRKIHETESAFFLYMSFSLCSDINLIYYEFRQAITRSLNQKVKAGFSQWRFLALSLISGALGGRLLQDFDVKAFAGNFDGYHQSYLKKGRDLVKSLLTKCQAKYPSTDPDVLRAILWTLSQSRGGYAIKWLGGEEISASISDELMLPVVASAEVSKEPESFKIALEILTLLSKFRPILLCFDETEIPQINERGFLGTQVLAFLIKTIFDSCTQASSDYGLLMASFIFPGAWKDEILPLAGASDRMISGGGEPIYLKQLDGQSFPRLVKLLLAKKFYEPRGLTPPHPLYPFEEEAVKKVGKDRPPVRYALRWCAENFVIQLPPVPPEERFKKGLVEKLQEDYSDAIADSATVAEALRYGFDLLLNKTLDGETGSGDVLTSVTVTEIADVEPRAKNGNYINFKLVGTEQDRLFAIGVAVVQTPSGRSFSATMNRLVDCDSFGLTRGCLIRDRSFKIKTFWESYKLYQQFIQTQGGEHVEPEPEALVQLLALRAVFENASIYGLTEAEVREFSQPIALESELLREILSDPSGAIDPSIIDDETLLDIVMGSGGIAAATDENDEDDLIDLLIDGVTENVPEAEVTTRHFRSLEDYRGRKLSSFQIRDEQYSVGSWRELLIKLCKFLAEKHSPKFKKTVMALNSRKARFAANASNMFKPLYLESVGLYVETDLGPSSIVGLAEKLLVAFGYTAGEFALNTIERVRDAT